VGSNPTCGTNVTKETNLEIKEEFNNKTAKFILNELVPRAKALGIPLELFLKPTEVSLIIMFEMKGLLFRKKTREILDKRLNQLRELPKEERSKWVDYPM
jgi:hypothetical protein